MKSKIPCEPGPAPLMKLAQATGLCGGMLVPNGRNPPCRRSRSRCGSSPGVHHGLRQAGIHAVDADDDHRAGVAAAGHGCGVPTPAVSRARPRMAAATAADCFKTSLRLRRIRGFLAIVVLSISKTGSTQPQGCYVPASARANGLPSI